MGGAGRGRIYALVVIGSGVVAVAVALALSWIDTGEGATCGSVVHPSVWWDSSACRGVMVGRALLAAAFALVGIGLIASMRSNRPRRTGRLVVAAACAVLPASAVALAVNESVRSGGLF